MKSYIADIYEGNAFDINVAIQTQVGGVLHELSRGAFEQDSEAVSRGKLCLSAGIPFGYYHLVSNEDPQAQLNNMLDALDGNFEVKDTLYLDWESTSKGTASVEVLLALVTLCRNKFGGFVGLYAGYTIRDPDFLGLLTPAQREAFLAIPLWYQRYSSSMGPVPGPWTQAVLWQGSGGQQDDGGSDFIRSNVPDYYDQWDKGTDWSICNLDPAALKAAWPNVPPNLP